MEESIPSYYSQHFKDIERAGNRREWLRKKNRNAREVAEEDEKKKELKEFQEQFNRECKERRERTDRRIGGEGYGGTRQIWKRRKI